MHTVERQAEQLVMAGLFGPVCPRLSWVRGDISRFNFQERFVILAPGGAPHRHAKRWPVRSYRALAMELAATGLQPVVVGSARELSLGEEVLAGCEIGQ